MIITEAKPFEQILASLKNASSIYVIGCGRCATSCSTGGEKELAEMNEKLKKAGKKIIGSQVVEAPCDDRLVIKALRQAQGKDKVKDADAVLVMSCGAGVQTVAEICEIPTFPALDSMFLGRTKRLGKFYEMCIMCGDCVLSDTGGICPVSRCSKHLLSGPCGGSHEGKCEVNENYDCAWYLIYEKLKKQGKLDNFLEKRKPKDFSKVIRPRRVEFK